MLAHPESHFTLELFHAEMLCARGKLLQVFARFSHFFVLFLAFLLLFSPRTYLPPSPCCSLYLIQKM
jgi:hypothetical protein